MNCEELEIINKSKNILAEPEKHGYRLNGLGRIPPEKSLGFVLLRSFSEIGFEAVAEFPHKIQKKAINYIIERTNNFEDPINFPQTLRPSTFDNALNAILISELRRIIAFHYDREIPIAIAEVGISNLGPTLNVATYGIRYMGLLSMMFSKALNKFKTT